MEILQIKKEIPSMGESAPQETQKWRPFPPRTAARGPGARVTSGASRELGKRKAAGLLHTYRNFSNKLFSLI